MIGGVRNKVGSRSAGAGASQLVTWTYYLLVFSIPFECVDIGLLKSVGTITRILGALLIILTVYVKGLSHRRPPAAVICFAIFLALMTLSALLRDQAYLSRALSLLFTLFQGLIFCYLAYDQMGTEATIRTTIIAIALSCSLLAALQLAGVIVNTGMIGDRPGMEGREALLGQDYNYYALTMAMGLLCLTWLMDRAWDARRFAQLASMVVPAGAVLLTILRSGSRGVMVALIVSIVIFMCASEKMISVLRRLAICALLLAAIAVVIPEDTVRSFSQRWDSALASGNMAGREEIYPAAWQMVLERPFFGWGPFINVSQLGQRLHYQYEDYRDTHNLVLRVLTEAGIIGGAPFFAGFYLCYRAALVIRKRSYGNIALAVMNVTFIVSLSLTCYATKLFWLSLAFSLACGHLGVNYRMEQAPDAVWCRP